MTLNYEALFQEHLLVKVENRVLTDIKLMLEKEVESLAKMVSARNATIRRLDETVSRMCEELQEQRQEIKQKEVTKGFDYDLIKSQARKILILQQQRAEIYEASKEWVVMYGTSSIMPRQTQELLNKLKEVFTYDHYRINEETNEWVGGCEKRVGYDDSQGYGSTEPTRKTPGSPKQSYDYRKVGL